MYKGTTLYMLQFTTILLRGFARRKECSRVRVCGGERVPRVLDAATAFCRVLGGCGVWCGVCVCVSSPGASPDREAFARCGWRGVGGGWVRVRHKLTSDADQMATIGASRAYSGHCTIRL